MKMALVLRRANILLYTLSFLGTFGISESASADIRRLQSKVDFVLDTVIEVKQGLQDLRVEVSNMQQENNTSGSDMSLSRAGQRPLLPDNVTELALAMGPLIDDFKTKIAVVLKGFQEEKTSARQILKEQGESLKEQIQSLFDRATDSMNIILNESNETNIRRYNEMTKAIAVVNMTVYERFDDMENGYDELSDQFIRLKDDAVNADGAKLQDDLQNIIDYIQVLPYKILAHLQPRDDIKQYGTSLYKYHSQKVTWAKAQEKCKEEHGHLVEISDTDENEFVQAMTVGRKVWLGGTDAKQEGRYHWVESGLQIQDIFWGKGEPNDRWSKEDCVHDPHAYNDIDCNQKIDFVCEVDLVFIP